MGIVLALLIFSFIVIIHELGHLILAKKNGIKVSEFSVGMGPRILSKEFKGTRYSWKLLPLGGSCMMGEDEEDDQSEGSFNSKSVFARMSVIVAGPIFNFLLAFVLATIIVIWIGYDAPILGGVTPGYSGEEQGLQKGDEIVRINGKKINLWREVTAYNQYNPGKKLKVEYMRDGKKDTVTLTPKKTPEGNYISGLQYPTKNVKGNIFTSMLYGVYEVRFWIDSTISGLKMLVTGGVGIDQMSGPVGIVSFVGDTYEASKPAGIGVVILNLMNIAILLSANLGVMNLLPLPALDGGRLVFLIIEAVRKKRVPPEKEGIVHLVGIVLLLGLMAVIMFNDIKNLFIS